MTSEAPFNNRKNVHVLDASIETFSNANELAPRSFRALSLLNAPRCVAVGKTAIKASLCSALSSTTEQISHVIAHIIAPGVGLSVAEKQRGK